MSTLVVGVDGSDHSKRALAWALEEARLRGAALRVVSAWSYPVRAWPNAAPLDASMVGIIRREAEEMLDAAVEEVSGGDPGVELTTIAVEGSAAECLLDAAADADLLVLGSRGLGGFGGLLLGSVGQQCSQHARCPVVIVPRRPEERR